MENIVKTAKTGLGVAGAFIPDKAVTETFKTQQPEKRSTKYAENIGFVAKSRDKDQSNLIDDEGLPLVYSQEGIQ